MPRGKGKYNLSTDQRRKLLRRRVGNYLSDATVAPCPGLHKPCKLKLDGNRNKGGYPLVWAVALGFKSPTCAHVVSYLVAHNQVEADLPRDPTGGTMSGRAEIHHLCSRFAKNNKQKMACRSCIEPTHLALVTMQKNRALANHNTFKTHCPYGHSYADALVTRATYKLTGVVHYKRLCRTCSKLRSRRYHETHKESDAVYHKEYDWRAKEKANKKMKKLCQSSKP
jgi:hypothetical protein